MKKNWHRIYWIGVHGIANDQIDTYKVHKHDTVINIGIKLIDLSFNTINNSRAIILTDSAMLK